MIQLFFTLSSHMFFVYLVFQLLKDLVKWDQILKVTKDNARKVRLLVVSVSYTHLSQTGPIGLPVALSTWTQPVKTNSMATPMIERAIRLIDFTVLIPS